VSDTSAREHEAIVFVAGAGAYWRSHDRDHAVMFIATADCVFTWGEIYICFPALWHRHYGSGYAATNAGWLYTARARVVLVPVGAGCRARPAAGTRSSSGTVANLAVAATAFFVIKPMRTAHHARLLP